MCIYFISHKLNLTEKLKTDDFVYTLHTRNDNVIMLLCYHLQSSFSISELNQICQISQMLKYPWCKRSYL